MNTMNCDGYRKYVLESVPRLLSQLDRDPSSSTYGCFDRNHWHYKIRDFSSIILQQGTLSLALLYSHNFPGNIYFKKDKIRDWAIGSLQYWISQQLYDGSFNEYWPNEHGYPPTVFSLFSTAESFRLCRDSIDPELESKLFDAFNLAGNFISKHIELEAQNQEIASIAALQSVLLATGEERLLDIIRKKRDLILQKQSSDGWFSEYGGADIGYLSVSLNYMAEYFRLSGDNQVLDPMKRTINFLQYFVHPDGTTGGEYGSRNTEYFLPGGLEIIAPEYPLAGSLADALLVNIDNPGIMPRSVDDRYLSHYFLHSYIRALLHYQPRINVEKVPHNWDPFIKHFKESKIVIVKSNEYYAIFNGVKGVLKVYSKSTEILNDCGYVIKNGRDVAVTNWQNTTTEVKTLKNTFCSYGSFYEAPNQVIPTPFKHITLRVLSNLTGQKMIPLLKKQLILKNQKTPIFFSRKVTFSEDVINIEDCIRSVESVHMLFTSDSSSKRFVPSSKYFQDKELNRIKIDKSFKNVKGIKISKYIDIKRASISWSYQLCP